MAKQVTGFMTASGEFCNTEAEADFQESSLELRKALEQNGVKNVQAVIELIYQCGVEITHFLDAAARLAGEQPVKSKDAPDAVVGKDTTNEYEIDTAGFDDAEEDGHDDNNISEADIGGAEEETEAVLTLPPGVHKPLPDVGRHIQPPKVRHQGPVNGPRGGRSNAPGLRRR